MGACEKTVILNNLFVEIQRIERDVLPSFMEREKAKSIKPSNNKTGNNAKSICARFRKFLNTMLKLEPSYAQHIIEIEKCRIKYFLFSSVRNYIQGNADLLSPFY